MKVTIGIPTYNRNGLVECMSQSLNATNLLDCCNIRIYDDCSTEYSKDELQKLFPTAVSIVVNPINFKADKNMFSMYQDFVSTEDDYFFNADSDFIFNKQWLAKGLELIKHTDGVLSLFNANSHLVTEKLNKDVSLKNALGAAGTLFKRTHILSIVNHFKSAENFDSFDWQWSNFLSSQGVRLFCVNVSLMQHIGYNGQNSASYFDVGIGFEVDSVYNGQVINDIMVNSVSNLRRLELERIITANKAHAKLANDFSYHFKRCLKIIIKSILPKRFISFLKKNKIKFFIFN